MPWAPRKKIAKAITEQKSDYILALKKNHKTLYEETTRFFDSMTSMKNDGYTFDEYTTVDGGHGRIETRRYAVTSDIDWLEDKENWPGLKSLGMVESIREINGESSQEKRYYISSLDCNAQVFGDAIRQHWGIENSVHWVLDIAFREDESRIRKGSGPENFAVIRHIALNLLKENTSFRGRIKSKRLNAAMDEKYLKNVIFG